jgi:hypothetical protein
MKSDVQTVAPLELVKDRKSFIAPAVRKGIYDALATINQECERRRAEEASKTKEAEARWKLYPL